MKLLDKLKNALFEEEYVEVEEKKQVKKKEKPIAKKIIVDEPKIKKSEKKEDVVVEEEKEEVSNTNKDFKFKAILDDDFIDLDKPKKPESKNNPELLIKEKPKLEKNKAKITTSFYEPEIPNSKPYGNTKEPDIKMHEYGSASKQKEKKVFHPSPIISPIYGVLDQNYKKDEISTKKEVIITSSYKSKNIDVDSVRAKAYGNADDIFEEELTSNKKEEKDHLDDDELTTEESDMIKEEDSLLDISANNTPSVSKVTMGDAEEYYSDLGLEYNIDYKDASHERATGRRTDLKNFKDDDYQKDEASIEENLFDLIDSMYDEKKGE